MHKKWSWKSRSTALSVCGDLLRSWEWRQSIGRVEKRRFPKFQLHWRHYDSTSGWVRLRTDCVRTAYACVRDGGGAFRSSFGLFQAILGPKNGTNASASMWDELKLEESPFRNTSDRLALLPASEDIGAYPKCHDPTF